MGATRLSAANGLQDLLVQEKILDEKTAARIQQRAEEHDETFLEAAVGLGFVTESDVALTLVKALSLPYLDATRYFVNKELFDLVTIETALRHKILPLDRTGDTLLVAICDCVDTAVLQKIERETGLTVRTCITSYGAFTNALKSFLPEKRDRTDNS